MQGLLLVAVLLIALLDMTNLLMRPFAFEVLTRTQGKACLQIYSTPFCPECWDPRLYRWNHRHNAEEVHRQLILRSRTCYVTNEWLTVLATNGRQFLGNDITCSHHMCFSQIWVKSIPTHCLLLT